MRTKTALLIAAVLALPLLAGCEKTIHEASNDRRDLPRTTVVEQPRPVVPAVDGVPIA